MQIPDVLLNEQYDDRYFDVIDALEEARQVFLQGTGLIEAISLKGEEEFSIGETGFGAGRLLIAFLDLLEKSGMTDISINYHSVELHPVTAERMAEILERFRPAAGSLIDLLVREYSRLDIIKPGWHRISFSRPFGMLTLHLWVGEALEMIRALTKPCDAWFLDGHSPQKNPSIWRPELLMAIGEKTKTGGTCATYTVAGNVRRGLAAAGFAVEKCPGFGVKKSALRGVKRSP